MDRENGLKKRIEKLFKSINRNIICIQGLKYYLDSRINIGKKINQWIEK